VKRYAREFLLVWRLGLARLLPRWWQVLLIVAIGAALVWTGRAWDDQLLQQVRQPDHEALTQTARSLSRWGDAIWALMLAAVLLAVGFKFGCPRWRQTGWAILISLLASTVILNAVRLTLGRPRPTNAVPDGFYGPHLRDHQFQSFPSGHATSAFAPAAAVAAVSPLIGAPCLLFASGVSWSRLQLNQHHPLDVATGAVLGTVIGLCFGSAVQGARWKMRRRKRARG
jgi:undecaprenyl-diphosphatase